MTETDAPRPEDAAQPSAPARIGATGGLDLDRFQQEVAAEIGLGPDVLRRLNGPRAQEISKLEQESHST